MFELHTARGLDKRVELRPFIDSESECNGEVEKDICVAEISKVIDCKTAFCSNDNDKKSIHEAIINGSPGGFEDVNEAVEMIRLEYLLNYSIGNIMGGDRLSDDFDERFWVFLFLIALYIGLAMLPFWPLY